MKLTAKTIPHVRLAAGRPEEIHFDDSLPGFGLRLRAGGSRSFIFQFKVGAQNRRMTLGSATVLSPARAREMAEELYAQKRLGRDPSAERIESSRQASETMGRVLENYLAFKRGELRARSFVEIERHLLRNAAPLHSLPVNKVTRRHIAGQVSTIAAEKGAVTANRARAALSAFFAWCVREGLVDANPVIGSNRWDERARTRVLSYDELKIIWSALGDDDYSDIIRMLMLTGQRLNEVGGLQWSEIVGNKIVLPPARCKNGREHIIPITDSVRALLDSRPRNAESVFRRNYWARCKERLDQRILEMGAKLEPWTRWRDFSYQPALANH
jgi:integrase